MEENYSFLFSASTNLFYQNSIINAYEQMGTLPEDVIPIPDGIAIIYISTPPVGMVLGADSKGEPCWLPAPQQSKDEAEAQAAVIKAALIREASDVIAPLKDASDGGYIDDADKPRLVEWQKYRYALTQVDISAGISIVWPTPPAE